KPSTLKQVDSDNGQFPSDSVATKTCANHVTHNHDDSITDKRAACVMHNHDVKEEQDYVEKRIEKTSKYTQNQQHSKQESECVPSQTSECAKEEFEFVKRELGLIFHKRNWSATEIDCLKSQMPIP